MLRPSFNPEIVKVFYDRETQSEGYFVAETTRYRVATGGFRISCDVTRDEVFHLARSMSYKFKVFDFPISGAKSALRLAPNSTPEQRQLALRRFALQMKPYLESFYLLGEDAGTSKDDVRFLYESVGLNRQLCSKVILKNARVKTPLVLLPDFIVKHLPDYSDFGPQLAGEVLALILKQVKEKTSSDKPWTIALSGIGQIGQGFLSHLDQDHFLVKGVSDKDKSLIFSSPVSPLKILELVDHRGLLKLTSDASIQKNDFVLSESVDVLIPASLGNLITDKNFNDLKCRYILEAANNVMEDDISQSLQDKNIIVLPDFLVNSAISTSFGLLSVHDGFIWSTGRLKKLTKELMLKSFNDFFVQSQKNGKSIREIIYRDWLRKEE